MLLWDYLKRFVEHGKNLVEPIELHEPLDPIMFKAILLWKCYLRVLQGEVMNGGWLFKECLYDLEDIEHLIYASVVEYISPSKVGVSIQR